MSGDAEQECCSDGISEDIITDLSKTPDLLVIARNSSFAYKEGGRREDGRARARRALRPRGQRPQGGLPHPRHRSADRRGERRACLGRPF